MKEIALMQFYNAFVKLNADIPALKMMYMQVTYVKNGALSQIALECASLHIYAGSNECRC